MALSRVLCLVIPAFPAWAFHRSGQVDRPLVVVAARHVIAASAQAKRAGIAPGMLAERARALLPGVLVRPRDRHLERAAWEEVLQELTRLTPFAESTEPGVAFARPPGRTADPADREADGLASADDLASTRALVHRLGARAGVASARSLARLAALRAAQGNTIVVKPSHLKSFLKQFPLALLPQLGYSPVFVERLSLFGYHTLFGAASLSRRHLKAQFGEEGARLYDALHPEDDSRRKGRSVPEHPIPLFQPPPTVTSTFDFDLPVHDPGEILPVLEHLAAEATGRLGVRLCRCVRLCLMLHQEAEPIFACRILPEASADARRLFQTAKTLLSGLLVPGREVDGVALELGALETARVRQVSLFEQRPTVYDVARLAAYRFPGALLRARIHPDVVFEEEAFSFEPFPVEPPVPPRSTSRRRR